MCDMKILPSKFALLIALMDSSPYEPERITAREKAAKIAERNGWSFEAALSATPRVKPRDLPPTRAETYAAEAGAVAARAKQEAKLRKQHAKLARLIETYGSLDEALAPCWRERILTVAVARWRVACPAPNQRWTESLDGSIEGMSSRVRRAISKAYPLPVTFAEAKIELDYWNKRDYELGLIADPEDPLSNIRLDLVASHRREIIQELVTFRLSISTLQELEQRVVEISKMDDEPTRCEWNRVRGDIVKLAARERDDGPMDRAFSVAERVRIELRRDKERSDREIARILGVSPTTVGKVRCQMNAPRTKP